MSGISPIGPMTDSLLTWREDEPERIEQPVKQKPEEDLQAPVLEASAQKQAFKTTVQGFQYTGKGSFIDKAF